MTLTTLEDKVVESLRIIAPEVERVSLVSQEIGIARSEERYPIVKLSGAAEPVSLASLGDGMSRLFTIVLALVNSAEGLLLIDEVENGLHYSIQPHVWRLIFETAERLDIQVFATTHSWDCIDGFQQAAAENPNSGVLIRLERGPLGIRPVIIDEEDLSVVAKEDIEVR